MVDTMNPEEVQNQVDQIREWLNKQSHLPKNFGRKLLLRFLHSCYYDVEKTKKTIEMFVSIRSSAPELFNNRDPLSPPIQKALKLANRAQYKITGNRFIWIWQLNDPGLDHYDYIQDIKLFFLKTDAWLLDDQELEDSDVALFDIKHVSLKFLTKFNISVARKLSKYQQEALPARIKEVHVINCPPFIDKLFALVKPLFTQEIIDMVHFHTPESNTLYQYIGKDDLPEDFGGTRGKLADYMENIVALTISKREYLLDNTLWRIDKTSKNKTENSTEIGSFRSLDID